MYSFLAPARLTPGQFSDIFANNECKKGNVPLKNPALFFGGIILMILGIALGIFFLVPNIPHIITDSNTHVKHAIACFALAALGILVALVNRPKTA